MPTFGDLLLVLDWLEVYRGDLTDKLHGCSLYQTLILLVPPSALQEQPLDVNTIL
ncbi:hypothetical protein DPMN_185027 [Dreissena polymorpha]|uniref:Uncharacterized protein n=1 Tax=Dreissena polymorpha TaxID=45954 RepID=A0A9D4DJR1_DREPO|nr:hypothetical protein DPMN_185027 [Dreissena polymorpha]